MKTYNFLRGIASVMMTMSTKTKKMRSKSIMRQIQDTGHTTVHLNKFHGTLIIGQWLPKRTSDSLKTTLTCMVKHQPHLLQTPREEGAPLQRHKKVKTL